MYAAAKTAGMTPDQLKTYVKNSLLGQKLYQQVIGKSTPTAAQMQAYYAANKAQFDQAATRTVRHILVKTKAEALKVRALLAASDTNATWAKVAKQYSIDTGTKSSGGNLGPIRTGQMVKPFNDAAFSLKLNTISAPVKSQYGWHIIEVTAITPAKKSTYASALGEDQEHADLADADQDLAGLDRQGQGRGRHQVCGGLRPRPADRRAERVAVVFVDPVAPARRAVSDRPRP